MAQVVHEIGGVERLAGRLPQQVLEGDAGALGRRCRASQPVSGAMSPWPMAASSPGTAALAAFISCAAAMAPRV